jgi:hypothetical protein
VNWPGIQATTSAKACPNSESINVQCTSQLEESPISSISTIFDCYMLVDFGISGEKDANGDMKYK